MVTLFWNYEPTHSDAGGGEVRMRFFERGLLLLEAGEEHDGIIRWLSGAGQGGEAYRALGRLLPEKRVEENWEIDFARQLIARKISLAEGRSARPIQWPDGQVGHTATGDEGYAAYTLEALDQMQSLPKAKRRLESYREDVLLRSIYSILPYLLIIGLGVGMAFSMYRSPRGSQVLTQRRIFNTWSPFVVVTVFVVTSILGGLIYGLWAFVFQILHIDSWSVWTWLEFLWRALPTCFLMFYFFGTPGAMIRSFHLNQLPKWREGVIALGLSLSLSWLIVSLAPSDDVDPSDWFVVTDPSLMDHVSNILRGVVAAPVFEELVFRGFLFCGLRPRWGTWKAALVSTALFAVIHTQYDIWGMISVGGFGLACCWLVVRTRSLTTGIAIHMILNGIILWWTWLNYQAPLTP